LTGCKLLTNEFIDDLLKRISTYDLAWNLHIANPEQNFKEIFLKQFEDADAGGVSR